MTTKPESDLHSILVDGRAVLAQARKDERNREFAARLESHELTHFESSLEQLAHAEGGRSTSLHTQLTAGSHVARARAAGIHLLRQVRIDAHLAFRDDPTMQQTFGVGTEVVPTSTQSVEDALLSLRDAAEAHPAEARELHLDAHAVHTLEDLIASLQGADVAHRDARIERHDDTLARTSLMHAVTAETAHIRLVARRAFMDDAKHLDRYKRTLPRRTVKHRAKPAATTT